MPVPSKANWRFSHLSDSFADKCTDASSISHFDISAAQAHVHIARFNLTGLLKPLRYVRGGEVSGRCLSSYNTLIPLYD